MVLLWGINVGIVKLVFMVKFVFCFEEFGYCNVKIVFWSGNVVF